MMILARDSRGMTQADLAVKLQVGQGTLSKYEAGLSEPPPAFVAELADSLNFQIGFFYELGRPHGLPPFHYRRRKKLSARALARIVAEMNIRRLHLTKLLTSFELNKNPLIPEIDPGTFSAFNSGISANMLSLLVENVYSWISSSIFPKSPVETCFCNFSSKSNASAIVSKRARAAKTEHRTFPQFHICAQPLASPTHL